MPKTSAVWCSLASLAKVLLVCASAVGVATGAAAEADVDARLFVLQPEDLPVSLPQVQADGRLNGHDVVYFHPSPPPAGGLWHVMSTVEVFASAEVAATRFGENQNPEAIGSSLPIPGSQRNLSVVRLTTSGFAAHDGLVFRVESKVAGLGMVEYRYRFRVADKVANFVVGFRARGEEGGEGSARRQADEIAARQVERLAAGSGP